MGDDSSCLERVLVDGTSTIFGYLLPARKNDRISLVQTTVNYRANQPLLDSPRHEEWCVFSILVAKPRSKRSQRDPMTDDRRATTTLLGTTSSVVTSTLLPSDENSATTTRTKSSTGRPNQRRRSRPTVVEILTFIPCQL